MIIEKEYLFNKVNIFLENVVSNDISNEINSNSYMSFFKSYLKKDESNCFTIVDIKNSIKCLFNQENLIKYFNQYPSDCSLNDFDGTLIYIKKSYFDILFNKEGEDKINSKITLIIEDFDLDQTQKMSNELFNQKYVDINLNPDIEEKIENILYNIIKKRTDNDEIEQNNIK